MDNKAIDILIIEDDLIIAENIKENLYEIGYTNIHIANNYAAVHKLHTEINPDIFLVDIHLNRSTKDGIDIMLSEFPDRNSGLIYISSLSDQFTRNRAKKTNPSAYLVKPFSQKQLEVAIDFALSEKKKSQNESSHIEIDSFPFISDSESFFVKVKDRYERINKADIVLLHSDGAYTDIITLDNEKRRHYLNLKKLIKRIGINTIIRCHNSYAVNVRFIQSFDNENLYLKNMKKYKYIPLGRTYKDTLMRYFQRL